MRGGCGAYLGHAGGEQLQVELGSELLVVAVAGSSQRGHCGTAADARRGSGDPGGQGGVVEHLAGRGEPERCLGATRSLERLDELAAG